MIASLTTLRIRNQSIQSSQTPQNFVNKRDVLLVHPQCISLSKRLSGIIATFDQTDSAT
jgi:hypothetical protein